MFSIRCSFTWGSSNEKPHRHTEGDQGLQGEQQVKETWAAVSAGRLVDAWSRTESDYKMLPRTGFTVQGPLSLEPLISLPSTEVSDPGPLLQLARDAWPDGAKVSCPFLDC